MAEEGKALTAALALASEIAALPQNCMRNDRSSAIEQWDLDEAEAIRNELRHGMNTLNSGEALAGSKSFREGKGRHGAAV